MKTWFITGASKGFGREWAEAALERGDRVAATARDASRRSTRSSSSYGDAVLPLRLDVTDRDADFAAVQQARRALRRARRRRQQRGLRPLRHGRGADRGRGPRADRDELLRRAVGHPGGAADHARAGLGPHHPGLEHRRHLARSRPSAPTTRRSGRSRASRQSLAQEVAGFGIHVTLIEPGGYATDWGGPSAKHSAEQPGLRRGPRGRRNAGRRGKPRRPGRDPRGDPQGRRRREPPLRIFFGEAPLASPRATTSRGSRRGTSGSPSRSRPRGTSSHSVRTSKPVERGLQDRLEVAGIAVDPGDGDDHVEDLLEREVVADLVRLLCGDEQRPAGGEHARAVAAEYGVAAVRRARAARRRCGACS